MRFVLSERSSFMASLWSLRFSRGGSIHASLYVTQQGTSMGTVGTILAKFEKHLVRQGLVKSRRNAAVYAAKLIGVDPITWRRWRAEENEPTLSAWVKIMLNLHKLEGQHGRLDRGRNRKDKEVHSRR